MPSTRMTTKPPKRVCAILPAVLAPFMDLGEWDAILIASMMRGETIGTISARVGVKYESVYLRWKKITRNLPAFGVLANGLMGCGRGRKPKAKAVPG